MALVSNGNEFVGYQVLLDNGTGWDPIGGGSGILVQEGETGDSPWVSEGVYRRVVSCGFTPDMVLFTFGETYIAGHIASATVVFNTKAGGSKNVSTFLPKAGDAYKYYQITAEQKADGFEVGYNPIGDDGSIYLGTGSLHYFAIKF